MEKVKYTLDYMDLWNEIMSTITLQCSGCRKTATMHDNDEAGACVTFFNMGWRFGRNEDGLAEVHCPKCVKKNE
jgi:hypothetical protein